MRIRSIKPEFWRSQDVADLSREHRLLWIGLWQYADDNGVGLDDYRQIAADLFALDDDPNEAREFVREGLATLSRHSRITRYTVAGRSYLHVNGWTHQRIDKPGKARYPLPPSDLPPPPTVEETPVQDDSAPTDTTEFAKPSRDSRETLAPGTGEQGNRGTDTPSLRSGAAPRKRATATRIPDDFANLITPDLVQWAHDNTPQVDGRYETLQFVDYWTSQPDRTGKKTDWIATWRKWMRKAQKDITDRRSNTSQRNTITGSARADKARGFLAPNDPLLAEWGTPGNTTPANPLSGFQPLVIEGGMTA